MAKKFILILFILFWAKGAQGAQADPMFIKQNLYISQANQTQFSEEKVSKYAKAAYAIEVKRAEILQRALGTPDYAAASQKAIAKGVTICEIAKEEQTTTIQSLCKELFNFAEQERRRNGFEKNSEFNQMTRALQQDSQLQERIRRKMLELSGNK